MGTATLVEKSLGGYRGTAHLYKLSAPIKDDFGTPVDHVVVSSIDGPPKTETRVFAATETGDLLIAILEKAVVPRADAFNDALAQVGVTVAASES